MKERPVLFKGEMVLRVLDDSKTQTRRVPTSANTLVDGKRVSPKTWKAIDFDWRRTVCIRPSGSGPAKGPCILVSEKGKRRHLRLSPVWEVGDHLWVRETWSPMWKEDCDNCWEASVTDPDIFDANGHCEHFYVEYKADTGNSRPGDWPDPEPNGDFADAPAWKPSIHMFRWASRIDLKVLSVRVERVQEITEDDALAEGVLPDYAVDCIKRGHAWAAVPRFKMLWDSINKKRGWGWDTNRPVWAADFKRIKP